MTEKSTTEQQKKKRDVSSRLNVVEIKRPGAKSCDFTPGNSQIRINFVNSDSPEYHFAPLKLSHRSQLLIWLPGDQEPSQTSSSSKSVSPFLRA
jgi:hypothetical protein